MTSLVSSSHQTQQVPGLAAMHLLVDLQTQRQQLPQFQTFDISVLFISVDLVAASFLTCVL